MPFVSLPSPPNLFPTYLVPSFNFRRRKSSTDSTASASSTQSASDRKASTVLERDLQDQTFLTGNSSHLRCSRCLADLALSEQIISKGFTGRHGRAYLVSPSISSICPETTNASTSKAKNDALPNLPNTYTHRPVPRQLVTGAHTVSDISCAHCGSVLGWKYVAAEEEPQKYKVGKFILETKKVCRTSCWEDEDDSASAMAARDARVTAIAEEDVEFDSEDEDECEDLFIGLWTPQSAANRRRSKRFDRA